jgi:hypothetical protein
MLDRLHEYLARLRREQPPGLGRQDRYQVAAALLNLTGPVQADTLEMLLPLPHAVGLRLKVVLRTFREESAADTLAGIASHRVARCILPWIPLMQGGSEPAIMEEWKRLAALEPDSRVRAEYAGLALVFAELAKCRTDWQQALEGWNVLESQQVKEWQAAARTEARLETKRADLLQVLRGRFRKEIPADLVAAVQALTDWDELSRWFDAAVQAKSLAAFRTAIQQRNSR